MNEFITHTIAEYIKKSRFENYPPKVIHRVKECILDSFGCMFGGIPTQEGNILLKSLLFEEKGKSSIIGYPHKTTLSNSIFINSMSANILDFDDCYIGHPGATIIPPAINLAELLRLSGKDLITAVVIAYEISLRIGINLQPLVTRKKVLGHGTWQVFGSTSAACKLLDLYKGDILNAFGIAGANAPVPSVMKTTYGFEGPTMTKNNFGSASIAGVQSALLAKNGFTGPKDIFEGETGFWQMIGMEVNRIKEDIFDDIHENFIILDVGFKFYPCCRLMHSTIDIILDCIQKNNIEIDRIIKINIKTITHLSKMPFINKQPKGDKEGRFSIPYGIACAVHKVNVLKWYERSNIYNREILNLAAKVEIESNKQADIVFQKNQNKILSEVYIILDDNRKIFCDKLTYQDQANTFLVQERKLEEKFFQLAHQVLKSSRETTKLFGEIMELEKIPDIAGWLKSL